MTSFLPKKRTSSPERCAALGISGFFFLAITIAFVSYFSTNNDHYGQNTFSNNAFVKSPDIEDDDGFLDSFYSYYNHDGEEDLVETMINLDYDSCSDSPTNCGFNQYSGYLKATNDHEIHYWFFTADTEDDPMTKPIFFWTNGGPGCSGAFGLFTEMGPWRVLEDMTVIYNPYTWITEVNMVFLEQPYGVGFSVVDPSLHAVAGDLNAAEDMDAMIRNFLVKFPQYSNNAIYISSESWGGHYIPMTAWQILVNNEAGQEPYVNFKGFLHGNPYTNEYEVFYGHMDALYGHGLMRASDYDEYRQYCWNNGTAIWNNVTHHRRTLCTKLEYSAYYSAKESYTYALDWAKCLADMDWAVAGPYHNESEIDEFIDSLDDQHPIRQIGNYKTQMAWPLTHRILQDIEYLLDHPDYDSLGLQPTREETLELYAELKDESVSYRRRLKGLSGSLSSGKLSADYSFDTDSYIPCSEYYVIDYLQLWDVQKTLNVKPINWTVCSSEVGDLWPGTDVHHFMEHWYTDIYKTYSEKYDIRMAIYSGDDDSVCPTGGTQYWLDQWHGFTTDENIDWIPWKDEGNELGGFYTIFHNEDNLDYNALHFITVRTAGHMVPTFEPGRSLTVLKKFLYEFEDWGIEYGVDGQ